MATQKRDAKYASKRTIKQDATPTPLRLKKISYMNT